MSDSTDETVRTVKEPSYADALIPLIALIVLISASVFLFGTEAVDGPVQVALILCCMICALIVLKNGHPWEQVVRSGKMAFESIVTPVFILFAVGALIGTWNMAGTIPTLVYYGIHILEPSYFYAASFLICSVVALAIGSSWTTAGTIGVGLVGLASLLGVSPAIAAGAVISGAYVGDKLSPLSETTVLTSQIVGVNLYTHLKAMVWTSGPAAVISLIVFTILGFSFPVLADVDTGSELKQLNQLFWITPWTLIPVVVLVVMSVRKVPASLAIMTAALVAGAIAPILQPDAVNRFIDAPGLPQPIANIKAIWVALGTGFQANSGIAALDSLLSRGGMDSMLKTLWIIMGAVTFGTLLDQFDLLGKLVQPLLRAARSTGRLFLAVVGTAFGLNVIAGDQYIALVLPARVYRAEFEKRGLKPQNLSRACADGGTVTSPLVPWNSCGAYMAATLGVATIAYLPFCIFNIASPIISVLLGVTGFKIARMAAEEGVEPHPAPV